MSASKVITLITDDYVFVVHGEPHYLPLLRPTPIARGLWVAETDEEFGVYRWRPAVGWDLINAGLLQG